jgi:methionyl-tRNA formyltransferase
VSVSPRFAFAGTPDFSAWVLEDLRGRGRLPVLVISQPERPKGRGRRVQPSPAAEAAAAGGLPCLTTVDINSPETLQALAAAGAQVLIVAAFGQLLRPALLDSLLCINIHASLLPAYRGAAPIVRALQAGESETGVCVMRMLPGLDDGPVALRSALSISPRDDAGSLGRKLALLGAVGVDQVLTGLADGNLDWVEQVGTPSYAAKLAPGDRPLDARLTARLAHAQVRSLSPEVGCEAAVPGLAFKVWRSWPYSGEALLALPRPTAEAAARPGHLVVVGERLFVGCTDGVLELLRVQPVGKNVMDAAAFVRGYASRLGPELLPTPAGGA